MTQIGNVFMVLQSLFISIHRYQKLFGHLVSTKKIFAIFKDTIFKGTWIPNDVYTVSVSQYRSAQEAPGDTIFSGFMKRSDALESGFSNEPWKRLEQHLRPERSDYLMILLR